MPKNTHTFKNAASTSSMIVEKQGEILLVLRKNDPFAGSWALPGGFLNCDKETLEEAGVRELREETSLTTVVEELSLMQVNSSPRRDPRGHVIDHIFIVKKYWGIPKAADDAEELKFFPLESIPPLAFDHGKVLAGYKEIKKFANTIYGHLKI